MTNHAKEFERRCEEKRKRGLVDMKFVTGDLTGATVESFCREANEIDDAIERGDFEVFSFNDSTHTWKNRAANWFRAVAHRIQKARIAP